jgi:rare lipoprotein A
VIARKPLLTLFLFFAAAVMAGCVGRPVPPPAPSAPRATTDTGVHPTYKVGSPYQINGVTYYPAEDFSYDETGIASWYGEDFHGKYTANGEVFNLNELTAAHRTLPMPCVVQVTNLENGRSIQLRVNDRGPFARGRIIDVSRRGAQLLGFETQGTAKVRVKILVAESIQAASLARRGTGEDKVVADAPQAAPRDPVVAETLASNTGTSNTGLRVASTEPPPLAPSEPPQATTAPSPAPPSVQPLPEKVTVLPTKPGQIYIQAGSFGLAENAFRVKDRLDPIGPVIVVGVRINGANFYRVRLGPILNVDEADKLLNRVVDTGLAEARIIVD